MTVFSKADIQNVCVGAAAFSSLLYPAIGLASMWARVS